MCVCPIYILYSPTYASVCFLIKACTMHTLKGFTPLFLFLAKSFRSVVSTHILLHAKHLVGIVIGMLFSNKVRKIYQMSSWTNCKAEIKIKKEKKNLI